MMETMVLPAQDHLASERNRFRNGAMPGTHYAMENFPKPRRKVRPSPQFFPTASSQSDSARSASSQNLQVVDANKGRVSPLPAPPKILRQTSVPTPTLQHSFTGLKKSHRSHQTLGAVELQTPSHNHQQAAHSFKTSRNRVSTSPPNLSRSISEGKLLDISKKVMGFEKGDRKTGEKTVEIAQNHIDGKAAEKIERPLDRRKKADKKASEKKTVAMQSDKSSTTQQKPIITILQRPQTKEAAAEHMAKFSGRNAEVGSSPGHMQKAVEVAVAQMRKSIGVASHTTPESSGSGSIMVAAGSMSLYMPSRKGLRLPEKDTDVLDLSISFQGGEADRPHLSGNVSPSKMKHGRKKTIRPIEDVVSRPDLESPVTSSKINEAPKSVVEPETVEGLGNSVALKDVKNKDGQSVSSVQTGHDLTPRSFRGELSLTLSKLVGSTDIVSKEETFDGGLGLLDGLGQILLQSPEKFSERWAGPAYTNSPPPNTLPFPTFPVQRVKSCIVDVSLTDGTVPGPMDSKSHLDMSLLPSWILQPHNMDPSSATKDLRRILNIDSDWSSDDESSDGSGNTKEETSSSATRRLKKILQLS